MQKILQILLNKNRWKSVSTYVWLLAYIPLVFSAFQVQITPEQFAEIENTVKAVLALLASLGILHSTDKE